jgi:hypothetical protein
MTVGLYSDNRALGPKKNGTREKGAIKGGSIEEKDKSPLLHSGMH